MLYLPTPIGLTILSIALACLAFITDGVFSAASTAAGVVFFVAAVLVEKRGGRA